MVFGVGAHVADPEAEIVSAQRLTEQAGGLLAGRRADFEAFADKDPTKTRSKSALLITIEPYL